MKYVFTAIAFAIIAVVILLSIEVLVHRRPLNEVVSEIKFWGDEARVTFAESTNSDWIAETNDPQLKERAQIIAQAVGGRGPNDDTLAGKADTGAETKDPQRGIRAEPLLLGPSTSSPIEENRTTVGQPGDKRVGDTDERTASIKTDRPPQVSGRSP